MSSIFKFSFLLIGLYVLSYYCISKRNNVCTTFTDYLFPEGNANCYYDPDAPLDTPDVIKKYAGSVETHEVTTEDGYILTMYRIPRTNPKGVILMHHSIATSPRVYLFQGNDSLAITLWRNGFDVWLANQRGTLHSDKHVNLTKYDFRYWDFSFHEMGLYDVSGELEVIRGKTNESKVIFLGHSLGSTMGLVYASLKPAEAQAYLKDLILLSPASHCKHFGSTRFILLNFFKILQPFTEFLQIGSPLVMLPFLIPAFGIVVRSFPPILFIPALVVWTFCGFTPGEIDPTFFNYDAVIYLDNYSWKTMYHFAQMTDDFKMYDHGIQENLKMYGNAVPPLYPIEKITVPTLMLSSAKDNLILQKDCEEIYGRFSSQAAIHGHWKYSQLNHLDFLNGLHRKEIFTNELMTFLNHL